MCSSHFLTWFQPRDFFVVKDGKRSLRQAGGQGFCIPLTLSSLILMRKACLPVCASMERVFKVINSLCAEL